MPSDEPIPAGNPAGFIADLIGGGVESARAAYREFHAAGGSMQETTFNQLFGEVRAGIANRGALVDVNYGVPLGDQHFTEWSAGRSGTFAHQVDILLREVGTTDPLMHSYTVMSDRPLSPADAIDQAIAEWSENIGPGQSGEGQVILGGVLSGAFKMTGRAR